MYKFIMCFILSTLVLLLLTACNQSTPNPPAAQGTTSASAAPAPAADLTQSAPLLPDLHAPHHGALIAFGQEFANLELVLDAKTGTLTGYALDGYAEQPLRLKQPAIEIQVTATIMADGSNQPLEQPVIVTLQGVADPLSGETVGDTSEFTGQADILKDVTGFKGSVAAMTIKGAEFKDVPFGYPAGSDPHPAGE